MKRAIAVLILSAWALPQAATEMCTTTVIPATGITGGTLTANTVPKATGAQVLGNSTITDNGTTVTVNTGSTFRASPPQNGATGMVDFIGTLTPNASGSPTLVRMVGTGAGSSTGTVQNFVNYILGGYTGSSPTIALYQGNENAGTNTTLGGGNSGTVNDFFTATTGHIYGTQNKVFGSTTLNVGTHNFLGNCNSAGTCVGSLNLVPNAGAGAATAGFFGIRATLPTFIRTAIQADNAAIAAPIAVFQDNSAALPTTGATATFAILDGAQPQNGNGVLTSATMTAETQANVRDVVSSYTWTNAQVVALGASTTGDITVATLPAKTQVLDALVVIVTPDTSANALTVSCGDAIGATPFINLVVASDAKATANTIYGDTLAERGTSIDTEFFYLPSYTATTLVTCHFIKTTTNLNTVTASTGRVILTTRLLP